MLGDERIATFQSQTDDTPRTSDDDKLVYHISDYLNSSSLDLSITGSLLQATDYLPFGQSNAYEVISKRIKGKKGGYTNKYKFANKQEDDETDLQYFEKGYYDNRIGRFTTEDPVYWEVGITKRTEQYFTDPQQWNSYSYVRNNPINLVDPTGEAIFGDSNPIQDTAWVIGTVARGYWEMGKLFLTEGAILLGAAGTIAAQNQGLVDVATSQGSTSPAPNSPNLGNIPGGKPPQKPDKPTSNGPRRFENDKGTILKDSTKYEKITGRQTQGAQWYKDKSTGNIVYRDNFHKTELEVFNKNKIHLGTADPITGKINPGTAVKGRTLK